MQAKKELDPQKHRIPGCVVSMRSLLPCQIHNAKSVFLAINESLCWLNNVCGVYKLNAGFLASYWSAGFGRFLPVSAIAYHWLEDCANLNFTPTPEENAPTTLTAIQASRQCSYINEQ
jgi:hypothetical protein